MEINDLLDDDDKLTPNQLCDHFIGLITGLNSTPLWLALQMELRVESVTYGDTIKTCDAITRVLTQFISHEQQVAEKAASDRTAGRALTAAEELTATGNKDPIKTTLDGKPKDPCPLCKKMGHWKSQCFQNPNADLETKKLALRIAPKLSLIHI